MLMVVKGDFESWFSVGLALKQSRSAHCIIEKIKTVFVCIREIINIESNGVSTANLVLTMSVYTKFTFFHVEV